MLEIAGGRYALIRYSIDFWLRHFVNSANKTDDFAEMDALLEAMDELHDRHEIIKEHRAPRMVRPILDAESPDESLLPTKTLKSPYLKEMIVDCLRFETSLKKQEFASGTGMQS